MDELTEPEDWKFEPLRELDRMLRCSICFEYFKTAMMMPNCSHNYCSLCIRRHLQTRQLCPMCAKPVIESQLQCNRLIDELVSSFKSNRNAFMALLANTTTKNGLTTPSTVAMVTAGVVGGALASASSLSSPLCVPQPPSASGTSILDLMDSELSQGLLPPMDTRDASSVSATKGSSAHDSIVVESDEGRRRRVKERPSSLPEGAPLSSPATSTATGDGAAGGSSTAVAAAAARSVVVSAVVHPQTPRPGGHSRTNKTPSRRHSEGLIKKSQQQKEESRERSRGQDKNVADVSSSSGSGCVSRVEPQGSATSGSVATPTSSSNVKVPCPVCQVEVFEKFINTHLDKCLNQTTPPTFGGPSSHASSSSPRLKRLPKLAFTIMTDKQLRKQLKEYHLPTQGKRDVLLKRIKEFTLLYNAECDALNPRTMKEVAQEVERAERSKLSGGSISSRKASIPSSSSSSSASTSSATALPPPPRPSRKSSDSEIAEMREQYLKAHDGHFSKLIADARAREVKHRSSSGAGNTVTVNDTDTVPHDSGSGTRPAHTAAVTMAMSSGDGESAGVREGARDNRLLLYQELDDEESQIVFASDSPSPPLLGRGSEGGGARGGAAAISGGRSGSSTSTRGRLISKETTSIPESPTSEQKTTPASRKKTSTRNKRSNAISLSTLYQDEEEDTVRFPGDEDPDFVPLNTPPFKARKKQKRC